ncbi:phosphopantetheine-binding protein [Streptomyces sp. NPDC086549]|uniref:phosphopantetheine-binding protein n=1 Tax=Streptomyces sp. NPDC086549 TaxID=3365752 RepID=UPI0038253A2C
MSSEPTAPSGAPGELLAELTAVLAGVLHVEPDRIDPEQPFQILGLDSMLTVEFVTAVNNHFGIRIAAAELYDHATPAALARHVEDARSGAGPRPPAQDPGAAAVVLQVLREQLARILHCAPWEIDPGAAFAEVGIDSILAAEFMAGINRAYGLTERPVTVYEHPSLAAMASYVASRSPGLVTGTPVLPPAGTAAPAAPGPQERTEAGAARRSLLSADELDALLDAVRDDRLSVDEAAALLTDRAA